MRRESAITILATGANIATTATSASIAIPNTTAGTKPRFVRVASTQPAYVKLGVTAPTAAAGDILIQPADSMILAVGGSGFIAAVQVAAAGVVNVTPLEDMN